MKKTNLKIAGTDHEISGLGVGETIVFPGCGEIVSSAIKRQSKNRYQVICIFKTYAYAIIAKSTKEAHGVLQDDYNQYGTLLATAFPEI